MNDKEINEIEKQEETSPDNKVCEENKLKEERRRLKIEIEIENQKMNNSNGEKILDDVQIGFTIVVSVCAIIVALVISDKIDFPSPIMQTVLIGQIVILGVATVVTIVNIVIKLIIFLMKKSKTIKNAEKIVDYELKLEEIERSISEKKDIYDNTIDKKQDNNNRVGGIALIALIILFLKKMKNI